MEGIFGLVEVAEINIVDGEVVPGHCEVWIEFGSRSRRDDGLIEAHHRLIGKAHDMM